MVDHANNSRQSSIEPKDHPNYYNQTKKEWTEEAAPKIKELNDLIANQTLAATLVEVYTAAKKANNCPA